MTDPISAGQKMVQNFVVVTPDTTVDAAEVKLRGQNASYCVIETTEGEPLALLTAEQLSDLPDKQESLANELPNLPEAVPVERDQLLSDIVQTLSPVLLGSRHIRGLIVLFGGDVVGILTRKLVSDHALTSFGWRSLSSGQLEGYSPDPPPTYFCPQGDFSMPVVSYNRLNPPLCPNHHIRLIRKKK